MAYREVTESEIGAIPADCKHAAHAMIFTKLDRNILGLYPSKSAIMVNI